MKSLEKKSLQEKEIISTLKEISVFVNFRMDLYEILLLKYRRLKYRMLGIMVIRFLIYVLFIIVIILIILSPNLMEFSGYWQIRSITSTVLSVFFGLYIKVDRIKRLCIPFKRWLKMIQQQVVFITNNYIIKRNLDSINEEIIDLNQRIDRFKTFFKPTIEILEFIGYISTIIMTFFPLFINASRMLEIIPYIGSSIIFSMLFVIPYFYFYIIDSIKLKHSEDIINVNKKLDFLLKRLSDVYFSKNKLKP